MLRTWIAAALVLAFAAGCGGGATSASSSPSPTPQPTPTPSPAPSPSGLAFQLSPAGNVPTNASVVHAGPDMQGSNANYLLCANLF